MCCRTLSGEVFVGMRENYRKEPWLNRKVEIRECEIHGKGMFAKKLLFQAEIVAIWGGSYVSKEEEPALGNKGNRSRILIRGACCKEAQDFLCKGDRERPVRHLQEPARKEG